MKKPANKSFLLISIITAIGAVLRIYHLGFKCLWFDEVVIYLNSQGGLFEVLTHNAIRNSAPPLFTLLISLITKIGETEVFLRSLSCIAGIISIPAIYRLAKRFSSTYIALFIALLVAVAPKQVAYSQEVREYSITFLLAILMIGVFCEFVNKPNWKNLGILTVLFSVAVFTQYGLALLIAAINIVFVIKLIRRQDKISIFSKWAVAHIFVSIAMLAVYHISLKHQMDPEGFGTGYLERAYWDGTLDSLFRLAVFNTDNIFTFAFVKSYLLLLVFLVGFLTQLKKEPFNSIGMVFIISFLITFLAACGRLYPYHGGRQVMFLTVTIYIILGFGFEFLLQLTNKNFVIKIMMVLLVCYGLKGSYKHLQSPGPENIRPLVKVLRKSLRPADKIYASRGASALLRFYYRENREQQILYDLYGKEKAIEPHWQRLDEIVSEPGRIWIVINHQTQDYIDSLIERASKGRTIEKVMETSKDTALFLALENQ